MRLTAGTHARLGANGDGRGANFALFSATLCRGPNGFDRRAAFLTAIRQNPVLATVNLVAEPWDLGLGGYQVGEFPSQWPDWNDRYRCAMRRYWSGEGSLVGEISRRIAGFSDIFNHDSRAPRTSINHITVHDGFTLAVPPRSVLAFLGRT